jgi:hypothetical protein
MSKKVSIAALCTGLLCTGLCACAYYSERQARPGAEPDAEFWELAWCGVLVLTIGVRGLLGTFDR